MQLFCFSLDFPDLLHATYTDNLSNMLNFIFISYYQIH